MTTINSVTLLGNVGNLETRYTPAGMCVLTISMATQERVKDKDTNTYTYTPEWHRVVCFGRTAEIISASAVKGTPIFVQGYLKTNKFKDKQTGQDRYATVINANIVRVVQKEQEPLAQTSKQNPEPGLTKDDFELPF